MNSMFTRSAKGDFRLGERFGDLLHRLGFAGEGGLLDAQAGRMDEPGIGRYDVAGFEQHHVTRHQIGGGHLGHLAGPPHPDYRRGELAQRAHGLLGLVLLAEAQGAVEYHDGHDDDRVLVVAEKGGHHGRDDEDDDEEGRELLGQDAPGALDSGFGELVGSVLSEPPLGFLRVEALRSAAQLAQGLICAQTVPVGQSRPSLCNIGLGSAAVGRSPRRPPAGGPSAGRQVTNILLPS